MEKLITVIKSEVEKINNDDRYIVLYIGGRNERGIGWGFRNEPKYQDEIKRESDRTPGRLTIVVQDRQEYNLEQEQEEAKRKTEYTKREQMRNQFIESFSYIETVNNDIKTNVYKIQVDAKHKIVKMTLNDSVERYEKINTKQLQEYKTKHGKIKSKMTKN